MAINITSLFSDLIETPRQAQQRQLQEGLLRAQQVTSGLRGLAATQAPLAGVLAQNIGQRQEALRQNLGGMLGLDVRNESEKLSDIIAGADPSSPSGLINLSQAIQDVAPVQALGLRQLAVQERRVQEDRSAAQSERERRADLEERSQARAEQQARINEQQLALQLRQLGLTLENRDYQREQESLRNERENRRLQILEDNAEAQRGQLRVATLEQQDRLQTEYNAASALASKADRTAEKFANLGSGRGSGRSGFIGQSREALSRLLGSDNALLLTRAELNAIRVDESLSRLPKGAASDKDVALVLSSSIDEYANPAQITSYLRGIAKLQAIIAEGKNRQINYIADNKGNLGGYNEEWRKMQRGENSALYTYAEGETFESYMEDRYGINITPEPEEETDNQAGDTATPDSVQQILDAADRNDDAADRGESVTRRTRRR